MRLTVAPLPAPSSPATTMSRLRSRLPSSAYWALSSSLRSSAISDLAASLEILGSLSASAKRVMSGAIGLVEEQFLQGDARVFRAHERFTDKEGMYTVIAHQLDVFHSKNAAFGDDAFAFRDERKKIQGSLQGSLETAQIAVVNPQQRGLQVESNLKFGAVMHLNQYIHSQLYRCGFELFQLRRAQCCCDQQDAVSPQCSR